LDDDYYQDREEKLDKKNWLNISKVDPARKISDVCTKCAREKYNGTKKSETKNADGTYNNEIVNLSSGSRTTWVRELCHGNILNPKTGGEDPPTPSPTPPPPPKPTPNPPPHPPADAAALATLQQANALSMEIYRECAANETQEACKKSNSCRFVKAGDVNVSNADPAVGQCRPSTIGLCEKCAGAVGYCVNRHTCGKCFGQGMTITDVTECGTYEQTNQPAPARKLDPS
jgi:hypothetical protein